MQIGWLSQPGNPDGACWERDRLVKEGLIVLQPPVGPAFGR